MFYLRSPLPRQIFSWLAADYNIRRLQNMGSCVGDGNKRNKDDQLPVVKAWYKDDQLAVVNALYSFTSFWC